MSNNDVWNAYLDKYNNVEPKDASQLQAFSKTQDSLPTLNFKSANETYKANKGKGKVGCGSAAAAATESKDDDAAAPVNPLFAALNKGGDITKGLKKVTRDMTNKDKKISGKIEEKEAPKKAAAPAKKAAAKKVKPPSMSKKGFRLWVENYTSGVEEITDVGLKNEVYLCNCSNAGFKISAKVKCVTIDSCKKVQIEIGDVLTGVDMINSRGCTLYLKQQVPTLNIDKCEAPRVVMFQECLDQQPQVITSMTSDMNISLPGATADDDFKDVPIPYQYITTVDPKTREVTTVAMQHSG